MKASSLPVVERMIEQTPHIYIMTPPLTLSVFLYSSTLMEMKALAKWS
jgi:hypothetical protein